MKKIPILVGIVIVILGGVAAWVFISRSGPAPLTPELIRGGSSTKLIEADLARIKND